MIKTKRFQMFKLNVSLNRCGLQVAFGLKWLSKALWESLICSCLLETRHFTSGSLYIGFKMIQRYLPGLWFANHPSRLTDIPSFFASHLNVPCFHWWTSVSAASAGCGQGKAVGRLRDVLDRRHSCRPSYQAPPIWAGSSYLLHTCYLKSFKIAQNLGDFLMDLLLWFTSFWWWGTKLKVVFENECSTN